ncbi:MAG TPA: signal peptidase I [Mobilitalea sp.]|nr:signal peptidase I [Mobilitalea sp.]
MKKFMNGALFGLALAVIFIFAGTYTKGAPILSYVYSNSMEPLIRVNDAFIVLPVSKPQVGDIIMYRPIVLNAAYITHRIIAVGEDGYITKGDNAPYRDQESGEPEVMKDRIVGKVFTIHGQPFVIPRLGSIPSSLKIGVGGYSGYLSIIFLILGLVTAFFGSKGFLRKRKPRHRIRLRHIYRAIVWITILSVMLSIFLGSRVSQIKYLVSEYPGTLGDQVEVNKPGQLVMEIRNKGLFPEWTIISGIAPLSIAAAPEYLPPRSKETVVLNVIPQRKTGIYQGYIQVYNYPIVLPRAWIVFLHGLHPVIAIVITGITAGLWGTLLFKILSHVHGFEEWIPLKARKDKLLERRMKQVSAKVIGRSRK